MSNQKFENKFGLNCSDTTYLQTFGPHHENTGQHGSEQRHCAVAKCMKLNTVAKSPSLDKCKVMINFNK